MKYTDPKTGITLQVFSSLYLDWGLQITDCEGEDLYYNPSCLCSEAYGFTNPDPDNVHELEWTEWTEWTNEEWAEALESDFDLFIEAYLSEEIIERSEARQELKRRIHAGADDFFHNLEDVKATSRELTQIIKTLNSLATNKVPNAMKMLVMLQEQLQLIEKAAYDG